jgi:hypothetical protein
MKVKKEKKGQFVIIAVLLAAIMIVSIGAIMHTSITYYKHEPWEEYSTLIGDIEVNSRRLVELSLVTFTHTLDPEILANNLRQWQEDIAKIYYADGIALDATLAEGASSINNQPITFSQGLARSGWNTSIAVSAAKADFTINITSIGLKGYEFSVSASITARVLVATSTVGKITLAIQDEGGSPINDLTKTNFMVNNDPLAVKNVTKRADPNYYLVYDVGYDGYSPPFVQIWDQRGITVVVK